MLEGLDLDFGEGSGEGWSGGHGIIERMTCFNRDKPSPFGAQKPRMCHADDIEGAYESAGECF